MVPGGLLKSSKGTGKKVFIVVEEVLHNRGGKAIFQRKK